MMIDVYPIDTPDAYARALDDVDTYFEKEPEVGSSEAVRFEVLTTLITAYEAKHHVIEDADPIAVLRYLIESGGRSQKELGELLGAPSRASEVMNKRRKLTLGMVRSISEAWHVPLAALSADYSLARNVRSGTVNGRTIKGYKDEKPDEKPAKRKSARHKQAARRRPLNEQPRAARLDGQACYPKN